MKYYLKVALLTLIISVVAAELVGPQFGLRGYITPFVNQMIEGEAKTSAMPGEVASLELTNEEPPPPSAAKKLVSAAQALDICVASIKQVSLHSEFTQVPAVAGDTEDGVHKMVWGKKSPARTMNADGADVAILATCHVSAESGHIILLSINGRSLVNSPTGSANLIGGWTVERNVSDVDNSTNVTVTAVAQNVTTIDGASSKPELILHCGEDKTIVYVGVGLPVGAGTIPVTSEIGDDKSQSRWSISTDRKNIFPDGRYISLTRQLMAAEQAKFSMSPQGGDEISFQFDLRGLPAAVFPLQEACHWK